jgi:hypothetical protein
MFTTQIFSSGKLLAVSEEVVDVADVEMVFSEMRSHQFHWELAINDIFNSAM